MYVPAEAMRAMNPQRGEPPLLVPDARYATARVPRFTPEDLQAAARSMACHKSQFTDEVVQRVHDGGGASLERCDPTDSRVPDPADYGSVPVTFRLIGA